MRFSSHNWLKTRMDSAWFKLIFAPFFVVLAACAAPQTTRLTQSPPPNLPARHLIADVPFFAQQEHQCGPASMAMVLNHWGKPTSPEALTPQLLIPAREGSLQVEMLAAARRQGMLAVPTAPELPAVFAEVAAGNPVIVLQNLSLPISPLWHYAVVIGYDVPAQTITLHSGTTARVTMALSTFEHTWARGKHWAITVTPSQRLPVQAREADVLAAAAGLERVDATAAHTAYQAMTTRWPTGGAAWIGLGNIAYARKDFAQAANAYERATQAAPDAADAWHNLAWAYQSLGNKPQAVAAAQRAVQLAGPRLARYTESLEKLSQ
jgi:predicted double-glycine peptidase